MPRVEIIIHPTVGDRVKLADAFTTIKRIGQHCSMCERYAELETKDKFDLDRLAWVEDEGELMNSTKGYWKVE